MRWLSTVVLLALTATTAAASHKILVLPVDGTADVATRAKLSADIAQLVRTLDSQVAIGSATFADTALAVGCDPHALGCSDEVIATLGVDELVWGTATRDGDQIRLTVRRAAKAGGARELSTTIAAGDAADRVATRIAPLFSPPTTAPERAPRPPTAPPSAPPHAATAPVADTPSAPSPDVVDAAPAPSPAPAEGRRDRTTGIALIAGGGLGVVLGLALWASYASLQRTIDDHPVRTAADIEELKSLEDRASSRAIAGDVLVLAGLAAAGVGGYYLYRDHKRHAIAIMPAPIAHGAGLTITILGGL
jgi:hypothetical protein